MQFYSKISTYFVTGLLLASIQFISCNPGDPDVSDIQTDIVLERLDRDLAMYMAKGDSVDFLRSKYGTFFDNYSHGILKIPVSDDEDLAEALRSFVNDASVKLVNRYIDSVFKDMGPVQSDLEEFAKHYAYYFPSDTFPRIIGVNSFFDISIMTDHGYLGIGLDMFLGKNCTFYDELNVPLFKRKTMTPDQVVPLAIAGWFQSDHPYELEGKDFLSQMIHRGKELFYVEKMLPSISDTTLLGYTQKELDWCKENESRIWGLFIENKMLFSKDPSIYSKFMIQAPKTAGFPDEAPDRIASFIGWRIVTKYVEQSGEIDLLQLIKNKNSVQILEQSGYKP
jgi:hypothetical protein